MRAKTLFGITQVQHHPEEIFEDIIGNPIVNINEIEVVVGRSEDEKPDAKFDQDIIENDDKGVDVKIEISNVSDRESITKDDEETEQQLKHELVPNVLDEAEDKVKVKLTNEFTKALAEIECI